MPAAVISVESLGKKYVINRAARATRYRAMRDVIADRVRGAWRRGVNLLQSRPAENDATEDVWALQDVCFEVRRGEVVGIVGRNGAGKSTLLKILSRITDPTLGKVTLRGRVASLLEVGTGFHPELTGRENIFLNGSVLGMTRQEIRSRFDEIVDFAEVDKYLDTPVKRYSSGMYVRLAFAVAAHLESEILIVDEVLAVGDAAFQKKCLGKMRDVGKGGRTVLLVSHNMAAIEMLAERALLLEGGRLQKDALARDVIGDYLSAAQEMTGRMALAEHGARRGTGRARILELATQAHSGEVAAVFRPGEPFSVVLTVDFMEPMRADLAVVVENSREQPLFATHLSDSCEIGEWRGRQQFSVELAPNLLRRGTYLLSLAVLEKGGHEFHDVIHHLPMFSIEGAPESGSMPSDDRWGDVYLPLKWSLRQ